MREFERDKWGLIYKRIETSRRKISLEEIDAWLSGGEQELVSIGDRFEVLSPEQAKGIYLGIIGKEIERFLPAAAIVELGSGYGSILFPLARKKTLSNIAFLGGEYTKAGIAILNYLKSTERTDITVGHCDFNDRFITKMNIPENSIIFTSYAVHYLPTISRAFVAAILSWKPKAIIHFEPCYEHCDTRTLSGLMRRRYIEINDYNRNLLSLLRDCRDRNVIEMVSEIPCCFGQNPLLPASVISWRPAES